MSDPLYDHELDGLPPHAPAYAAPFIPADVPSPKVVVQRRDEHLAYLYLLLMLTFFVCFDIHAYGVLRNRPRFANEFFVVIPAIAAIVTLVALWKTIGWRPACRVGVGVAYYAAMGNIGVMLIAVVC